MSNSNHFEFEVVLICGETHDVRNIMLEASRQKMLTEEYMYIAIPYDGYTMGDLKPWIAMDGKDEIAHEAFEHLYYVKLNF